MAGTYMAGAPGEEKVTLQDRQLYLVSGRQHSHDAMGPTPMPEGSV
ncbi:hypothetical protein KIPB_015079, partial [Kipferlia bialata]|eukprot:g15079.t1